MTGDNTATSSTGRKRDYVDVRELHPEYVYAPCKYESCDNHRWVTRGAVQRGFTICGDHGPDVGHLLFKPRVRI